MQHTAGLFYCPQAIKKGGVFLIKYENGCDKCPPTYKNCVTCNKRHVAHFFCDKCEKEHQVIYKWYGMQLCRDCIFDAVETKLTPVKAS